MACHCQERSGAAVPYNNINGEEGEMKALFVIDMLKDFINKDGALYCGDPCRKIIPFVKEKIEEFHKGGNLVLFICDAHEEDDLEFNVFHKHCVVGTPGAEIIDELPVGDKDVIIKKNRYSAFYGTKLDNILKDKAISEVHIAGVCTSICVMDTVGDLRNRDYKVIVYKEGVADFDEKSHQFSLERMEKIYAAKVV
jgi:nicotinamidase/pyrazinamidase